MADTVIDDVRIEIDASADKAKESINKLIENLESLREATGNIQTGKLTELCNSIKGLSESMKELPKASDFNRLAKGIEKINSINTDGIETVTHAMNDLAESVSALNASGISNGRLNVSMDSATAMDLSEATRDVAANMQHVISTSDKAQNAMDGMSDSMEETADSEEHAGESSSTLAERLAALQAKWRDIEDSFSARDVIGGAIYKMNSAVINGFSNMVSSAKGAFGRLKNAVFSAAQSVSATIRQIPANLQNTAENIKANLSHVGDSIKDAFTHPVSTAIGGLRSLVHSVGTAKSALGKFPETLLRIGQVAGGVVKAGFHACANAMKSASGIVDTITSKIASVTKSILKMVVSIQKSHGMFGKFSSALKKCGAALSELSSKLKSVTRLLTFMLLRKAITAMFKGLGEAFQHLAQKSDDFNQKISELISSASYFSHQVAAMARPLIDLFGPALTYIINLLSQAISYINQFLSALTGKKFFTQAKKVATDYADSLGGVKKKIEEVKDATVGIDELNIISPKDDDSGGSGSGGAGDLEDCYEELAINQKILDLVQKLKDLLAELFQPMKQAWEDYGQGVIDAFHYALESVWQLIKDMAQTWKEVWLNGSGYELCKNILLLLTEILLWIGDIAVAWDNAWKNKGLAYVQSIFDMLNAVLSLIITISRSFRAVWNRGSGQEAIEHIYQILTNCHYVVTNLCTRFEEAWKAAGTGYAIAKALFDTFNSVLATIERITGSIAEWAANLNFRPLLTAIRDLLKAIRPIVDDIGAAFEWLFTDIIEPKLNWAIEQGIPVALEILAAALEGIHNVLNDMEPETLQAIGKAIIAIAGCVKAVEVISKIAGAFASLKAVLAGSKIVGLISKIGEVLSLTFSTANTNTLAESFMTVFGTAGQVISSIVAIVGGAALAISNFISMLTDGFSWLKEILMLAGIALTAVGAVIATGVVAIPAIVAAIVAALATLVVVVKEHWQQICDFFTVTIPEWWNGTVIPFFQSIPEWFAGIWSRVKEFAMDQWNALLDYLQGIPQKISDFVTKVGNWFSQLPGKIGYALGSALGRIIQWGIDIWNYLSTKIPEIVSSVKTWFMELPGKIYDAISGAVGKVTAWASDVYAKFKEKVNEIVMSVKEWFMELPQKVYDAIITIKEKITQWVSDVKAFCAEKIPEIIDNIVEYFKSIPDKLKELGKDIIQGLLDGITNAWESLKSGVSNFCSSFVQGFKDALGIHSPSTEFKEIGGFSADGLVEGVKGKFSTVQQTIGEWAANVKKWFTEDGGINATTFTTYASNIISGFREKVGNTYTTVKDNITTWADKVRSWFTEEGGVNATKFTTFATNIIDGFKTRVGNYYSTAKDNISTWASKVKSWFAEDGGVNSKNFSTFATNIIDGFKSKVGSYYTTARDNIVTWGSKCVSWFEEKSGKSNWETVAKNVVDGFKNKIGSLYTTCKDTIQSWGSSIISWFKEKLDINSPSKVFEQLAGFTVQGFNRGIDKEGNSTTDYINSWIGKLTDIQVNLSAKVNLSEELSKYKANLDGGITQNTILRTVQETVNANGNIQATLESSGGIKEAFREAIREEMSSTLENIETNTKIQADKKETTTVYVGNREVLHAVEEQKKADGFSFTRGSVVPA